MKKSVLLIALLLFSVPAFADESQYSESVRYYNQSGSFSKNITRYGLNRAVVNRTETVNEHDEVILEPGKPVKKVIKQRKTVDNNTPVVSDIDRRTPMTYEQFPKNYDSSNSMMMMQNGMGGMMNGMGGMF